MTMDHAQVSELLGPLLAGRLDATRRSAVEDHLARCTECSAELRAVKALVALEIVELTPDERAELRAAVLPAARGTPRWARLMPAFAAAAVIALGVVAYSALDVGQSADRPALDEQAGADHETADAAPNRAGAESIEDTTSQAAGDEGPGGAATGGGRAADVAGTAAEGAPLSVEARLAPATFAATALDPAAIELGGRDLDSFARTLPRAWQVQLEVCTRRLFATQPVTLTLGFASAFPRDDLLVAGFTWSEATSGAPTNYAFWGWWRGDCNTVSPVFVHGTL